MLHTHASQQPGDGLNISPSKDVRQRIDHREAQGMNTDPPLAWKRLCKEMALLFHSYNGLKYNHGCVSVYLCWMYKAVQPGKRPPACRPSFHQLTSELQSLHLGSHWEGTTGLWSAQRSFHGTYGWKDLQRDRHTQLNMTYQTTTKQETATKLHFSQSERHKFKFMVIQQIQQWL